MASTVPWGEGAIAESRVLAKLPLAVFIVADDVIVDANDAACRLLGHDDRASLLGRTLADFRASAPATSAIEGEPMDLTARAEHFRLPDGTSVDVDLLDLPMVLEGRHVSVVVGQRVGRLATLRSQLVKVHGLATLGALAAGVAHEINNPLTYLMMGLERLTSAVSGTPAERHATIAMQGADRIRAIVLDLQGLARGEGEKAQPLDVEALLERVLSVTSLGLHFHTRVERDFEGVGPVLGHEGRLSQLFASMLVDAASSAEGEGTASDVVHVATRLDGDSVEVRIASGERYRTSVRLPVSRATDSAMRRRPASSMPSAANPQRLEGRPRLLVVDDDPLVRDVIAERLERFADVELARSADEAIDRLGTEDFHAVLADLMMPDGTGMDLHAWIAKRRPHLLDRMVFMTGGAFTAKGREFLARVDNPVVEKPVVEAELLAALVRVLGRARRTADQSRSA